MGIFCGNCSTENYKVWPLLYPLKKFSPKSSLLKHNDSLAKFDLLWNQFPHFWLSLWSRFLLPLCQNWKSSIICLTLVVQCQLFLNYDRGVAPNIHLAVLTSDQNSGKSCHKKPNFRRLSLWYHAFLSSQTFFRLLRIL